MLSCLFKYCLYQNQHHKLQQQDVTLWYWAQVVSCGGLVKARKEIIIRKKSFFCQSCGPKSSLTLCRIINQICGLTPDIINGCWLLSLSLLQSVHNSAARFMLEHKMPDEKAPRSTKGLRVFPTSTFVETDLILIHVRFLHLDCDGKAHSGRILLRI